MHFLQMQMAFRSSLRASQDVVFTFQVINKFHNFFQSVLSFWLFHQSGALICTMFCANAIVNTSKHANATCTLFSTIRQADFSYCLQCQVEVYHGSHRLYGKNFFILVPYILRLECCIPSLSGSNASLFTKHNRRKKLGTNE